MAMQRDQTTTIPPEHGQILGYYAVIWDANIKQEMIIPICRSDVIKGSANIFSG
jgi:hypothetical protein